MGKELNPAFLLTAGVGSRLSPHTDLKPKPTLPFLGIPLMNYGFYLAQQAHFKNYLFNIHHLPEHLKKSINTLAPMIDRLTIKDETTSLLGSGGAIWNAKNELIKSDYFLIANGDEVLIPKEHHLIKNLISTFRESNTLCTLLVCEHPELLKTLKPVWISQENNVLGFGMTPPNETATPIHYTGYKVFSPRIFDILPAGNSNIFYDVLKVAIKDGAKVNVHKVDNCHWHETGNFLSFLEASKTCLLEDLDYFNQLHQFYYKEQMELITHNDNYLYKPKNLHPPQCFKWSGVVCLSHNVTIEADVSLHNVFTEPGVTVKKNSTFSDQFLLLN